MSAAVDCNCGYGGYHEPLNPLCQRNMSAPAVVAVEDRDAIHDWPYPLGNVIRDISGRIDATYPPDLDPEAHLLRRVMKVSEEVGEVTEALFGALGENARKGQTHTMHDVRRELLDVALAALAALCHFDDDDPIDYLVEHAQRVDARLAALPERGVSS